MDYQLLGFAFICFAEGLTLIFWGMEVIGHNEEKAVHQETKALHRITIDKLVAEQTAHVGTQRKYEKAYAKLGNVTAQLNRLKRKQH